MCKQIDDSFMTCCRHAVALGSSAVNDPLEPSRQYGIQSIKNEQELAIITLAEEGIAAYIELGAQKLFIIFYWYF